MTTICDDRPGSSPGAANPDMAPAWAGAPYEPNFGGYGLCATPADAAARMVDLVAEANDAIDAANSAHEGDPGWAHLEHVHPGATLVASAVLRPLPGDPAELDEDAARSLFSRVMDALVASGAIPAGDLLLCDLCRHDGLGLRIAWMPRGASGYVACRPGDSLRFSGEAFSGSPSTIAMRLEGAQRADDPAAAGDAAQVPGAPMAGADVYTDEEVAAAASGAGAPPSERPPMPAACAGGPDPDDGDLDALVKALGDDGQGAVPASPLGGIVPAGPGGKNPSDETHYADVEGTGQGGATTAEGAPTQPRGEHEAATEELRATREELRATREELRATREELRATREELRATREDLERATEARDRADRELKDCRDRLERTECDLRASLDDLRAVSGRAASGREGHETGLGRIVGRVLTFVCDHAPGGGQLRSWLDGRDAGGARRRERVIDDIVDEIVDDVERRMADRANDVEGRRETRSLIADAPRYDGGGCRYDRSII